MSVDWKSAIGEVAKYAPAVATALGGPGVGGVTAGAAKVVSSMLGIDDDPASFVAATKNPELLAKLQQINNDHERELLSLRLQAEQAAAAEKTKQMTEVNATIRAELGTEGWFKSGWRPAIGWVMALAFAVMSGAMAYALIVDPSQLPSIMDGIITLIVAMGTVLGVNINARTTEKHLQTTGTKPLSLMDAIKTRVAK
ncbi:3TM-type holin [Salinicola peritrichatus]|uniref:3TM-type holin n=1 Tax=Salinicola peritrichatus TaxID=1267424 RepID=UPI000DA12870|nr:3TM-type holin [Salinicola peritrichatus]